MEQEYLFKMTLDVYPEADGGRESTPVTVYVSGDDISQLKAEIDECILTSCRNCKANPGKADVDMFIEDEEKLLDEDTQTVWISSDFTKVFYSDEEYQKYESTIK